MFSQTHCIFAPVSTYFVALEKGIGSPSVASSSLFSVPGAEEGAVHGREQAVLSLTSAVGNLL